MDETRKKILQHLCNDHSYEILVSLMNREMSANELSSHCNIPLQTVYRLIKHLERDELIKVARMKLDERGHHYRIFKANVSKILVMLDGNGLEIKLIEEDRADRLASMWRSIREVR